MEGRGKVQRKKKWQRRKRFSRLLFVLALLVLILTGGGLFGFLQLNATYHRYLALAQSGTQHLRSGMALLESLQAHPFVAQSVNKAQGEFVAALNDVSGIQAGLRSFSSVSGLIPIYGSRLETATHLAALAVDASLAGIGGCKLLKTLLSRLGRPLNASAPALTSTDFTTLSKEFQAVKTSLNAAMNEALLLQPGDVSFDAHVAKQLLELQVNIPTVRNVLVGLDQVLPALPTLLGIDTSAHYLVEILDSAELRPGGGFIGNYGILTIEGGHPLPVRITDAYLLDKSFQYAGHSISYPPSYQWFRQYLAPYTWSLRDLQPRRGFPHIGAQC